MAGFGLISLASCHGEIIYGTDATTITSPPTTSTDSAPSYDAAIDSAPSFDAATDSNANLYGPACTPTGFAPMVTYSTGGVAFPDHLAVADFNGDGLSDVIVAGGSASSGPPETSNGNDLWAAQVLVSTGNGFRGLSPFSLPYLQNAIAVGNFASASRSDVVFDLSDPSGGSGALYVGRGDGTFYAPVTFATVSEVSEIVVGDFNADRHADIAINGYDLGVFLNNANGGFAPQATYALSGVQAMAAGVLTTGHANGDLAVIVDGAVSVLLSNSDGVPTLAATYATGANSVPSDIAVGDFNGDGIADLAVADRGTTSVGIFFGVGDGTFGPQVTYAVATDSQETNLPNCPTALLVADFNGDGSPDIAYRCLTNGIGVLVNQGDGTFGAPSFCVIGGYLDSVAAGDFNGDGRADIVIAFENLASIGILSSQR
jgi:hypothetical protein